MAIKAFKKILFVTLITLVMLPVVFYFLIKLPAVQTFFVHRVTNILSEQMAPANVSVGAIHYSFFTKLVVDDIYASDLQGDTLLYVKELSVSLTSLSPAKKKLSLQSARINGGVFNLYTYPLNEDKNTTNINAILEKFKKNDTLRTGEAEKPKPNWDIKLKNLAVTDFRFTFRNIGKPTDNPDPSVIDFKNMDIRDIHVDARNIRMAGDTLFFDLNDLQATERSGYCVKKLTATQAHVCATQVLLQDAVLVDNYSHLTMRYYKMDYENAKSFGNYVEDVSMEADFNDALFSFKSIGYMARNFRIQPDFRITGVVGGPVTHLRSNFVQINSESSRTRLLAKFRMDGLPAIDETLIYVNVVQLTSDADDLTNLLNGFTTDTLNLGVIKPLTVIRVTGNFTGLYNDFATRGTLATNLGNAKFDLSFGFQKGQKGMLIKGDAQPYRLHLGELLNAPTLLGEVSGAVAAEGIILPAHEGGPKLNANGHLSQLGFLQYDYKNITVNGIIDNRNFDGAVNINDPNLKLAFDGSIEHPEAAADNAVTVLGFNATIHHADLAALRFNTRDSISVLSAAIKADYSMKTPLDGIGNILVSDIHYTGHSGQSAFGDIAIRSDFEPAGYRATLQSDILKVDYAATKPMQSFFDNLKDVLVEEHLPVIFPKDTVPKEIPGNDEYHFKALFKNTTELTDFIVPGLYVAPNTELQIKLTNRDAVDLQFTGKEIAWNDYILKRVALAVDNESRQAKATLDINSAIVGGLNFHNITSEITAADNKIDVKIDYDNRTEIKNNGNLSAAIGFFEERHGGGVVTNLRLNKSEVAINDSIWTIAPAQVLLNEKIKIDNFHVYNDRQEIKVDGVISHALTDTLAIEVENFDVANINYVTNRSGYSFKGLLSGRAQVVNVYNTLRFAANVATNDILINGHPLGRLTARSWWDNREKQLMLRAAVEQDTTRILSIRGLYAPDRKYVDLTANLSCLELAHIEPVLNGVLTNIEGCLSGEARVYGDFRQLTTEGHNLYAHNVAATVDYLKTRYRFSTPVFLDAGAFGFRNATVRDSAATGAADLSVVLTHNHFKDLQYDVTAYPRNLHVLNTTRKDNDVFYGKAYATGAASIKGGANNIVFDINLKAERNSGIYIQSAASSQAKEMGLLSFVQPATDTIAEEESMRPVRNIPKLTNIDVALNVSVTPETEVVLVLDENSSDEIHSFGSGDIKMEINTAVNKFELYGDYLVDRGDYSFAIQNFNILQKQFHIEQGGRITFNGDLSKTNLNLSAVYKTVASLNTLLGDTSSVNTRRPIDCRIGITGSLLSPVIMLSLNIQNIDALTQARVESVLDSDEKRARQFLSLIAFGTFMPDDQLQTNIGTEFLVGSATEILSSQLSKLLEQLKLPFNLNLGFAYMPTQQGRDDAYEVSFSTRIWDNRIVINGNVGSANSQTQEISNDFDADIRLTDKVHFRVFTRSVDQYTDNIDNTQRYGIGLMYQEEFNTFSELFNRVFGGGKKPAQAVEQNPAVGNKQEEEPATDATESE